MGHLVTGFVDDAPCLNGRQFDSEPVLGASTWLTEHAGEYHAIVAVGDNGARKAIASALSAAGVTFSTVVARDAIISPFATLGEER